MKRTFHQTRTSICPECHNILGADYVQDEEGLHLEKYCPKHGFFNTRVAADYDWLSSLQQFAAHTVVPATRQTPVSKGCPADCGECEQHRQKSAFFLFEITNACDLNCPICLGNPGDKGHFISLEEMSSMVDAVLTYAGPGQNITLGGGEPTLHPKFFDLVDILRKNGLESIWVYTNGCRIAKDPSFAKRMAEEGLYVVLQWDGFSDSIYSVLRGRELLDEKQRALENLKKSGSRIGLCPTIVSGINDQELGRIYELFVSDDAVGTLDIAVMAYVGKGSSFEQGRSCRTTSQDILTSFEDQTGGEILKSDFSPVSFSNPECLQIAYLLARPDGGFFPLKRFLDPQDYLNIISNKPLLELNSEVEDVFNDLINRMWAKGKEDPNTSIGLKSLRHAIDTLFPETGRLSAKELKSRSMDLVKVILVHSYMDGLNFDIGRARMCISRTVLPDGRLMPTCAYNVIHRSGPPVPV
ncbi:MAG: radical SAM protein [Phycisphaerae bacterium]|nr:radical SAM protein [Phycisphaerae bacterium]NIR68227.1 radical SAM protein [candidate division Zixibacteria bacterium]NIW50492.1 radical SAM protein [Gammaproteobacteria bacterium]NIP55938.1 radical SAM protein [Phycisphaerae bacterium]NIS54504.1 radical SAM protein [Phycisphaerae bacterium]